MFLRELHFQIKDDSTPTPLPEPPQPSIPPRHLTAKKLQARQKREELARIKSQHARVRDFLNGAMFLNWHFLTPDFQLLMLERLIRVYDTKQQMMKDVEFIVQMSVSLLLAHTTLFQCPTRISIHVLFFESVNSSLWYGRPG